MIKSMLAAGLVDDLRMAIVPVLLGGGLRLLPDGVSASRDLVSSATLSNVSLAVHYQRR
jgi:dihydrofolate reductase